MIVRFIRGYASEPDRIQATIQHLQETIKWREEVKAEQLRTAELPKTEIFRKLWPSALHGLCKQGRPVLVERIGQIDASGLEKHFSFDDMTRFHIQAMERLVYRKDELSQQYGRLMYRHIAVLDLNGLGTHHISSKFTGPMKAFVNIDQHHYSETLYRMIVCNTPWVFKLVWKLVRPWLHPLTREKILVGSNYLREYIDEDQIPAFLGGKCKCAAQKCLEVPFEDGRPQKAMPALLPAPSPAAKPVPKALSDVKLAVPEVNIDLNSVSECADEEAQEKEIEHAIDSMCLGQNSAPAPSPSGAASAPKS